MQCFAKGKCPYMSTALLVRQVVKIKSVDGYCMFTHYCKMSIYYKSVVRSRKTACRYAVYSFLSYYFEHKIPLRVGKRRGFRLFKSRYMPSFKSIRGFFKHFRIVLDCVSFAQRDRIYLYAIDLF